MKVLLLSLSLAALLTLSGNAKAQCASGSCALPGTRYTYVYQPPVVYQAVLVHPAPQSYADCAAPAYGRRPGFLGRVVSVPRRVLFGRRAYRGSGCH